MMSFLGLKQAKRDWNFGFNNLVDILKIAITKYFQNSDNSEAPGETASLAFI